MPAPLFSEAEAQTNRTFDAVLNAMAMPGRLFDTQSGGDARLALIATLLDHEVSAWSDVTDLMPALHGSTASLTAPDAADWLFPTLAGFKDAFSSAKPGSDLYPDDAATVVVPVAFDQGPRLRLSGPGIAGTQEVQIALPADFWPQRASQIRYPMGVDLILCDGAHVMGVPRSTAVEVL